MYLWVRSGSVDLQKVYYNGLYNSAADSSSAFVRLDQFAATYSDYLSYTSLDAPVKINHTSLNIDGSYKPREYFNISGKKYNMN